ncbi:MAG: ion transporter [Actinomycetota bacterium]|nr:ion transporter [Actinomycetota bacterium]
MTEDDFDAWLEEVTDRADPFMAWLGLVFALIVGYQLAAEPSPAASRALDVAGWAIWAVFVAEFAAKLWLAPRRLRFLRRHWLQALALAVPTLRVLRFLRLVRLGRALPAARVLSSSYRTAGTARRVLRSRLGYLAAVSSIVALAIAELELLIEGDAAGAERAFSSLPDALVWSLSVVVAMQGDPVPTTLVGRMVMLVGFAFGLIIVASLAGSLGAFLVEDHRAGGAEKAS